MADAPLSYLLRKRMNELREAAAIALERREKASELATYEQAIESYAEWERIRRGYQDTADELEKLLIMSGAYWSDESIGREVTR